MLGTDQLARLLGQRLAQDGESLTFIGNDQENLVYLEEHGFRSIRGNPVEQKTLEEAGIGSARALIGVTVLKSALVEVCRLAIARYQVPVVIARTDDPETGHTLQAAGVRVVQSSMAIVFALEVALNYPTAFSILIDKEDGVEVKDIRLENNNLVGQPLRQVRLPGNALVIGIQREGEIIVPHGDTRLNLADNLLLLGSAECLSEATRLINGTQVHE